MNSNFSIKQGHSIYIYNDEISFIESILKERGVDSECLDKGQNILTLNQSYIGYIKTNRRIIELAPKHDSISLNHIMRIYYFVYGNFRNLQDEIFDLNSSLDYKNIIEAFISELRSIKRKGLPTEYVSKHELSKYIRGSIDYIESYKNMKKMYEDPFSCITDELSMNTSLNRILKAAFTKVLNMKKHTYNLNSLKGIFSNVENINYKNEISPVVFDSKNFYCKNAYFLAKLILDESYFDNKGNSGGECFLINSDELFEQFIKKILFYVTKDVQFTYWNRDKEYGVYSSITKSYRPDIVYRYSENDNKAGAILDVKNKFSSAFKNTDVYQMLFYSGMLSSKKLILCYPAIKNISIDELDIYSDNFIVNKVYATYIDISGNTKQDFSDAIYKFIDDVYACLEKK